MSGEVQDRLVGGPCEVLGSSGLSQAPEVGWEHGAPRHPDAPRATLVGEEDHIIMTLVDVPQQAEEELEGLAYRGSRPDVGFANAPDDQSVDSAMNASVPSDCSVQVLALTGKAS